MCVVGEREVIWRRRGDEEEVRDRVWLRLLLSKGARDRDLEREREPSDLGVRDRLRERERVFEREYNLWRCGDWDRERDGGDEGWEVDLRM